MLRMGFAGFFACGLGLRCGFLRFGIACEE